MKTQFWTIVTWTLAIAAWGSLFFGYSYAEFLIPDSPHSDGTMSDHKFAKMLSLFLAFGLGALAAFCPVGCRFIAKAMLVPAAIGGAIALGLLIAIGVIGAVR